MPGWTIDELAEQAAKALAAGGVRVPNGRVTPVPDRRLIRWYSTIGLLDPPLRTRGRTARYGERHLLQLVAVKRRQADGRPLTEIQAEVAGATDSALRRIAALPNLPASPAPAPPPPPASAPRSWSIVAPIGATGDQDRGEVGAGRERFWTGTPTEAPTEAPIEALTEALTEAPAVAPTGLAAPPAPPAGLPAPELHYSLPLHPAVSLTVPVRPGSDDLAAIHAAARPLLDLLAARGLLTEPRRPQ